MAGQEKKEKEQLKSEVAKREEKTLVFWRENDIFAKSVEMPAGSPDPTDFVFYDGPPFATGLPHFGHLLPTALKDAIPRYQTMRGRRVRRRWGWDCHGLPVENIVEKELGLKTKKDIEQFGLAKFNEEARQVVLRYVADWERIIPRLGRFVDMTDSYRTMDASYTESIWWAFQTLYNKGLIAEGYKAMQICPRCETTLANFEVNLGYKDIVDLSVYVKFELVYEPGVYFLAWTTTPWTLPGNTALAVGEEIDYVQNEDNFIFAKDLVVKIPNISDKIKKEFKGRDLVGKKYKPIFDYYANQADLENKDKGWRVYSAPFITTDEGTGIVHIAPAFGEEDMKLGQSESLPFIQHLGMDGRFKSEVVDFAGLAVKPKDNHQETDIEIIKYLAHQGHLFAKQKITHSYPHCWRCDTPLLNYAASSWFVKVTEFKDQLVQNNSRVNWLPEHIKDGRFGKWLAGARDWAISRSRFWGAPIPVWRCDTCSQVKVVGSLSELAQIVSPAANRYFIIRHGESQSNLDATINARPDEKNNLTEKGQAQAQAAAAELQDKKIDLIINSGLTRTKETADILASQLGLKSNQVLVDDRFAELNAGDFEGRTWAEYWQTFTGRRNRFYGPTTAGETVNELRRRAFHGLASLEEKYKDKNILIVTHAIVALALELGVETPATEIVARRYVHKDYKLMSNAEIRSLEFSLLPRNPSFDLDLHRPYIDEVVFACACGGQMRRVEDVFDCWFESGSMPYAESHYPFNQDNFNPEKQRGFPADFIAEGLDQTRGWFYSLIVLATALFGDTAYKNVIVNGLILAEDGQKMSKRLNNYPDINLTLDKYGADALRLYLLSSPAVHADDFSFQEAGLQEMYRKVILRLDNVLAFYHLYVGDLEVNLEKFSANNTLDRWLFARLAELTNSLTMSFDQYEVDRVVEQVENFVDDLSTWYIRRSRDRFKSEVLAEKNEALNATGYVLAQLAKLLAPLAPFMAEHIYQSLNLSFRATSVHLESWPILGEVDKDLIDEMAVIRGMVEEALSLRAKEGIKVRQPLAVLKIKAERFADRNEFLDLLKEEINVKSVIVSPDLEENIWLDFNISTELKREGQGRELIRQIQDLRKDKNLNPEDLIVLYLNAGQLIQEIVASNSDTLKKTAGIKEIKYEPISEMKPLIIDGENFEAAIVKI